MPAQTPIPTRLAARHALSLAARLLLQILAIGLHGLLFVGAHRRLPSSIRLRSPGFLACSAMFFIAAWLRHGMAGHEPAVAVLLGAGLIYAVLLLVSMSQRLAEFTLCLCISIAADLLATALTLGAGISPADAVTLDVLHAWTLAAVLVALVRLRMAQPVRMTMSAEWPTPPQATTKD
jgi:hypothetical protein